MGSSLNELQAAKIQQEIKMACRSLEKIGYDSVVIVTSHDSQTVMGSERGRKFIEHFDLVMEFQNYHKSFVQKDTKDRPVTLVFDNYVAERGEVKEDLDNTDEDFVDSDLPIITLDRDEPKSDIESDDDKKPIIVTSASSVVPESRIFLFEQTAISNAMKKTTGSKCISLNSNLRQKADHSTVSKQRKSSKKVVNTQRKIRKTGTKTYNCDECNRRYSKPEYLTFHNRSKHTGERPYVCQHCGKSFLSLNNLNAHKYVHSETSQFTCEMCGRSFKRRDYLWRHKLSHATVQRQFVCDVCGKAYVDPSNLRRHKLSHVDKRPHHCDVCGGSFRTAGDLCKHKRLHTGEKPFTCERCGESFRLKHFMLRHQKRKHAM